MPEKKGILPSTTPSGSDPSLVGVVNELDEVVEEKVSMEILCSVRLSPGAWADPPVECVCVWGCKGTRISKQVPSCINSLHTHGY